LTGVGAVRLSILEKLSIEAGDWRASDSRDNLAAAASAKSGSGGIALSPGAIICRPGPAPFAPDERVRFRADLLGDDDDEKDALRLNDGRRSRSLWRTLGWRGLPSTATPSPALGPGLDFAGDADEATLLLLLLLLPPPKKEEKNGAVVCVGVAAVR
jgi:hypothetical protein